MRGLKYQLVYQCLREEIVAPFAGAWIEIQKELDQKRQGHRSHPSRVRGLKYSFSKHSAQVVSVAPFAGAWIEIDEAYFYTLVN